MKTGVQPSLQTYPPAQSAAWGSTLVTPSVPLVQISRVRRSREELPEAESDEGLQAPSNRQAELDRDLQQFSYPNKGVHPPRENQHANSSMQASLQVPAGSGTLSLPAMLDTAAIAVEALTPAGVPPIKGLLFHTHQSPGDEFPPPRATLHATRVPS